ncbi:MAG: hypothetical protein KDA84_18395 [Planctomycetaceae bacterium]|nr:hypothetical protein [Planctomycetaceae bacterium]
METHRDRELLRDGVRWQKRVGRANLVESGHCNRRSSHGDCDSQKDFPADQVTHQKLARSADD